MAIYCIYCITNIVNNKKYIGYTSKTPERRFQEHIISAERGSDAILHKSIRKHGKQNFTVECIVQNYDKNYIKTILEPYYIKEYNSFFKNGLGYNMTHGGDGGDTSNSPKYKKSMKLRDFTGKNNPRFGKIVTKKTRHKMSLRKKGKRPPSFDQWSQSSKDTIYYHNPETGVHCRIKKGDIVPEGFIKGNIKVSISNTINPRRPKPVHCIELNMDFDTLKSAAQFVKLKCPRDIVDSIIGRNQRKTAAGYHWKFI